VSQTIEVRVPDLGNFAEVSVIDVLVKAGDKVEVDTPLITLETEKATMDVPSSAAGIVEAVHVQAGGKVSEGVLVVTLRGAASAIATGAPAASASRPPAPAAAAAPSKVDVTVPDMGNFKEVGVIEVLVKPGDKVEVDTPLVTLETEKATMDVPSTAAGTVESVHVQAGGKISAGGRVVTLSGVMAAAPAAAPAAPVASSAAAGPASVAAAKPATAAPSSRPASLPPVSEAGFSKAHAGPSVRKLARELGVDLGRVKGGGQRGRITHDDVKAWVKQILSGGGVSSGPALPQVPTVDFAKFGEVEIKPLGRIQKISSSRLHASWVNLVHVTQFDEADITSLEAERAKLKDKAAAEGVKLTPLAFVVRAAVLALREFPTFNSSFDASGENVVLKKYINIGFAADTPNGLLVPVIANADKLDVYGIARALADMSDRARKGTLKGSEMQGGTFTITSLGGIGGTAFTPIINAPEVAILGVSRTQTRPVWQTDKFVPRQMLPLSLSYDHRMIDGALGARFAVHLSKLLADPAVLLAGAT
jgi:pyruvate dehydrogenase E2 component (dihydrolipoamide acetyltransferase)